jgi:hypothetical protein
LHSIPGRTERLRHRRKYAQGDLGDNVSFYFRGPKGKLNLKAQNLILFMQLADGVDDETWEFHLRAGHYTQWFREVIKNPELADDAEKIAADGSLSPRESRAQIHAAIERRFTMSA